MERSIEIGALAGALAKAQGSIQGALKARENSYYSSRYADLSSVWDACRAPLPTSGRERHCASALVRHALASSGALAQELDGARQLCPSVPELLADL